MAFSAFEQGGGVRILRRRRGKLDSPDIHLVIHAFHAPLAALLGPGAYRSDDAELGVFAADQIGDNDRLAGDQRTDNLNPRAVAVQCNRTGILEKFAALMVLTVNLQRYGKHQSVRPALFGFGIFRPVCRHGFQSREFMTKHPTIAIFF